MAGGALTVSAVAGSATKSPTGGNTATGNGGGIYQAGGTVALKSRALVMGNAAAHGRGYVQGGILTVNYAGIGDTSIGAVNVASANGGGFTSPPAARWHADR